MVLIYINVRQGVVLLLEMQGSKAHKVPDQHVDSLDAEWNIHYVHNRIPTCQGGVRKVWDVNSINKNHGKQGKGNREGIQWLGVRAC